MRGNKQVANMVHDAFNNNGEFKITKKGEEIWRAKREDSFLHLWHYGTLILSLELPYKLVQHVGGYSDTDRNNINMILEQMNFPQRVCRRGEDILLTAPQQPYIGEECDVMSRYKEVKHT